MKTAIYILAAVLLAGCGSSRTVEKTTENTTTTERTITVQPPPISATLPLTPDTSKEFIMPLRTDDEEWRTDSAMYFTRRMIPPDWTALMAHRKKSKGTPGITVRVQTDPTGKQGTVQILVDPESTEAKERVTNTEKKTTITEQTTSWMDALLKPVGIILAALVVLGVGWLLIKMFVLKR